MILRPVGLRSLNIGQIDLQLAFEVGIKYPKSKMGFPPSPSLFASVFWHFNTQNLDKGNVMTCYCHHLLYLIKTDAPDKTIEARGRCLCRVAKIRC